MARNSTHDVDALASRLDAVERAVTTDDGTVPPADVHRSERDDAGTTDAGDSRDREVDDGVGAELEALRERVATLEAELDAVRGLLGGVQAVDESVERRADAALAKVERLESSMTEESGLVVERVPVDEISDEARPRADGAQTATDRTSATERDESNSLAARLREAF